MSRNKYTWTEDKIAKYYKEGRGKGELKNYLPWLTIHDVPSKGRSHRPKGWKTNREHQLLSDLELSYFYYLEWSNKVIDIREQFPLNREDTLKIASEKNIPHPFENSTQTPIVMTTDFLATSRIGNEIITFARSIKPSEDLEDPRVCEKLEIERQYWEDKGIEWAIIDEKVMSKEFFRNLKYIHEYYNLVSKEEEEMSMHFLNFLAGQLNKQPEKKLIICCNEFDSIYNLDDGSSIYYLRHLYARQYIMPNDMCKAILPHKISLNEVSIRKGGFDISYGSSIS
ncbi:TnsA endonuclease N-terminal domain-containing protein [Schinkia azotoformans]|uniref:TnsA endonuclease N-terminal domain-containing protein n=1 Tax=Schinkia azotoformans TaxID=1454 RepID=UPI002DB797E9|nr:TnsA endonuclease N-terminal domain-containing protein [Schinkia azotoformans]MEC1698139.1 TnsA endonuclease N-terminal domain-containing protein [Schinkia azotoformans]